MAVAAAAPALHLVELSRTVQEVGVGSFLCAIPRHRIGPELRVVRLHERPAHDGFGDICLHQQGYLGHALSLD